jgi:hypothetical protein
MLVALSGGMGMVVERTLKGVGKESALLKTKLTDE